MKKSKKSRRDNKGKKVYQKPQLKTEKIKFQSSVQCSKTSFTPGCTELLS